ncbi:ATP-binding protein [Phreatobacter sp. AB_2022a]|uniref:ATP-binding protein n=1 Tax=Phreatobacter sp. AB_2022a TaxID=3003134 RepID=UPI00228764C6|nr:ATP-binding protein [Phreatobacter sp. AB_2022a]MCZ0737003.1 ATP-binding protein [Phreatobacter sp. AB_2022a]
MPAVRAPSLARRLFVLALTFAVVLLTITGLVLAQVNRDAVERGFDRRLGVYVKLLIADVAGAADDPQIQIGANLGEPLFELPQSGWYWQVTRVDGGRSDVRASRSLFEGRLPSLGPGPIPEGPTRSREGYVAGPTGQRLRAVERTIELGEDGEFVVMVAGDADEITGAVSQFNLTLVVTLVLLGIGMVVAALLQVRVGLTPLKRLVGGLSAIRTGEREHLEGTFPAEIAPLAREVNALIDTNKEIVERARTHVGNLAHALKTPISVIQNEAAGRADPLALKVGEQVGIMRDQVNHHLERARVAARVQVATTTVPVAEVVGGLARTMEKIHRDRELKVTADVPAGLTFRGERHDLEEMVGNLVDNACKWADRRVLVTVRPEAAMSAADRAFFTVTIDDDGPGLSAADREAVGRRGKRLDETKPGTGLGLSIASELAALYGGRLVLDAAPLGGLRAILRLPTV